MGRKGTIMVLILALVFMLPGCNMGNGNQEAPEDVNGVDQPQPEPTDPGEEEKDNGDQTEREIHTVEARFIGLADANSGEFEILESREYHFEQELNVFRFGEEVIQDFTDGTYDEDEKMTLYITIEQGEGYNIYTIVRAQTSE